MRNILLIPVTLLLLANVAIGAELVVQQDKDAGTISVLRAGDSEPILTQNARQDYRPYMHPIVSPDGKGVLTEYQPGHHPHQTGLYWGFKNVNERDYFHNPEGTHWRRVSATVLNAKTTEAYPDVEWRVVYDLLDESGDAVMRESQTWKMRQEDGEYVLDLVWNGEALQDVTIGEEEYSGLFLRMPWKSGDNAEANNSMRDVDSRAEKKRAVWLDVGIQVDGRDDTDGQAHIAIFDHPENRNFPQPWRVDKQYGVGPASSLLGEWTIPTGQTAVYKHQLRVYTKRFNDVELTADWSAYGQNQSGILSSQWRLAQQEGFEAEFLSPARAVETMTLASDFAANVFASEPMITQPMAFTWDDRGRLWIAVNRDYRGRVNGYDRSFESQILILEDTDGDGVADDKKVFLDKVLFPSAMAVGMDGLWLGAIPNLLFIPDRDHDDRADVDDIEVRLTGWGDRDLHETLNSLHWGPDGWLYGLQGVFTPSRVGIPAGASAIYDPDAQVPEEVEPEKKPDSLAARAAAAPPSGEWVSIAGKSLKTDSDNKDIVWTFDEEGMVSLDSDSAKAMGSFPYRQNGRFVFVDFDGYIVQMMYDGEFFDIVNDEKGSGDADVMAEKSFEYAEEPVDFNAGVWRYHPTKKRFEVVAHGMSNMWGIDYDTKGELFVSANVIPHVWHVIPGGVYHRQAGAHFNPYIYSDIRTIADHRHRSAHGGARFYYSDDFPEKYHGQLIMGNIHEHAVLTDIIEPSGSGYVAKHGIDLMRANNAQFIGFATDIGPDGALYVLDWHDADICGMSVRTKDTGRVFRISAKDSQAENWEGRYDDLREFEDARLVELQLSKSAWHARRARVILHHRAIEGTLAPETHAKLKSMFNSDLNGDHRLRAMWALHVTDGFSESELLASLKDDDEHVRAWAIRLLAEDLDTSDAARAEFARMAESDSSAIVRLHLASVLQRMPLEQRLPIAVALVARGEDADDHNIPKVLWFGIEPLVDKAPERAIQLARASQLPLVTEHIGRRMTDADLLSELVAEIDQNQEQQQLLLLGLQAGLEGRGDAEAPANWPDTYAKLRSSDETTAAAALEVSLMFGDALAAQSLVDTVADESSSLADRQQAIRGLAALKREELKPQLIPLFDDPDLRLDAIRAVSAYDDVELARELLQRYPSFSRAEKLETVHALSARPDSGTELMHAIDAGTVPRADIPSYVARLMVRVVGNRFLDMWGPVEGVSPAADAAFFRINAFLTEEAIAAGNAVHGKEIFNLNCSGCHRLHGEGGTIGPDLTEMNRADLDYLLENIITPSAVVADEYKMSMVVTDDGQVVSGMVADENVREIELRAANSEDVIATPKSQVTDVETTDLSMMPEGLLDHLSNEEVIDLIAYLQSLEPVN
ncbi:MAG: PVC-type heme-binding CxxCH protein [Woeseiaceae bacterium]